MMHHSRLPMDYGEWVAHKAGEPGPICKECRPCMDRINEESRREQAEREIMDALHAWNQAYYWSHLA